MSTIASNPSRRFARFGAERWHAAPGPFKVGAVILATHVKQAVLIGIGGTGRGKVKGAVHAFHQGCTKKRPCIGRD